MSALAAALTAALAQAPGRIFVGVSGGLDSTVLLHALAQQGRTDAVAVHVNHGLHPDAAAWQACCAAAAAALGMAFVARPVSVSARGSLEAAARAARYAQFAALLDHPDDRLLLAHHRDDQVETVLLRLCQGRGVYGMPWSRPVGAGRLIRPLLELPREVLAAYARHHGLSWIDDPANADPDMDRNFLRHQVLPLLRRRWPDVDDAVLDAMAGHGRSDQALLAELDEAAGRDSVPRGRVVGRPPAEAAALLRLWLGARGLPLPGGRALEEFVRQIEDAAADRQPRLSVNGVELRAYGERIYLVAPPPALAERYAVRVPGTLNLPHGELCIQAHATGFQPSGTVYVGFRRGGEALVWRGHRRTVKTLLREAGVAPWQRDTYPLLFDDAGLLALPGIACREVPAGTERAHGSTVYYRAEWRPAAAGGIFL
ncbi:MAG: tRNA lysidine(34) synthetase TilS [Gammaproteobacteria bacterium]|nr:tRNA lysidine(34) synthetase TilS [Gammaproteobacteria bacterium]